MKNVLSHMEANHIERLPQSPLTFDGTIQRFETNNSGKDGWYTGVCIQDGGKEYTRVTYGDWSKNITSTYASHKREEVPPHVKIEYDKLLATLEKEKEDRRKQASHEMMEMWKHGKEPSPNHPYLLKKKIPVNSFVKQSQDMLLVPVLDIDGHMISLQRIYPNGDKRFFSNLSVKNGYCALGIADHNDMVYVTESFANAYSIFDATKQPTYISFSAQTLPDVVNFLNHKFKNLTIVIVSDNDGENGVGQKHAQECAFYNENVTVIIPELKGLATCDISDVYIKGGTSGVLEQLNKKSSKMTKIVNDIYSPEPQECASQCAAMLFLHDDILSHLIDYYNRTSIQDQPGFALQTALAFCSIILGRKFKTNFNHYTSLYFLNIGKSGSGKEHQLTVIHDLLAYVGRENLLGASGYTSPGAITTALMYAPAHITLIDEFGDYLISLKDKNSQQRLVNKCLLQLFGRCNGSYLGEQYSKFSRAKGEEDKIIIKHPGLTLLAAVQPAKFYANIHSGLISDGFLGRFLIHESTEETKPFHLTEKKPEQTQLLLEKIKEWTDIIYKRLYGSDAYVTDPGFASTPRLIEIKFQDESRTKFNNYADYLANDIAPKLEQSDASELIGRWTYMVGCLSLIIALSRDPWTDKIIPSDMDNAIAIVEDFGQKFIHNVIDKINTTQYERDKNEFLAAIRKHGTKGITSSELARKKPFYRFPRRDRYAILEDLMESELIYIKEVPTSTKRLVSYYATHFK